MSAVLTVMRVIAGDGHPLCLNLFADGVCRTDQLIIAQVLIHYPTRRSYETAIFLLIANSGFCCLILPSLTSRAFSA